MNQPLVFSAIYFLLYSTVGSAAIMYSDSLEIEQILCSWYSDDGFSLSLSLVLRFNTDILRIANESAFLVPDNTHIFLALVKSVCKDTQLTAGDPLIRYENF